MPRDCIQAAIRGVDDQHDVSTSSPPRWTNGSGKTENKSFHTLAMVSNVALLETSRGSWQVAVGQMSGLPVHHDAPCLPSRETRRVNENKIRKEDTHSPRDQGTQTAYTLALTVTIWMIRLTQECQSQPPHGHHGLAHTAAASASRPGGTAPWKNTLHPPI